MARFIPGLLLNERFHDEVVEPLMQKHFPDLPYSAGLVGHGSEVLGFDTEKSTDHNWGPYLHLFFPVENFPETQKAVDQMLRTKLPYTFQEYSTNFTEGDEYRKDVPEFKTEGDVRHIFRLWTAPSFFRHYLGFDIGREATYQDWLLFPQQALIEVTRGKLYRDDLGIQAIRDRFGYYPDVIWRYIMRIQWSRIVDEMQMQARTGELGDKTGSLIITARTIHKIMFLCFLLERTYVPYSKWFGIAFKEWLTSAGDMEPLLARILREQNWTVRQRLLTEAYQKVGALHNSLNITRPVSIDVIDFYGRGYSIIDAQQFVLALAETLEGTPLGDMQYRLGAIDQFVDHAHINTMNYVYTELKGIIK